MLRALAPLLLATLLAASLGVGATRLPGAARPSAAAVAEEGACKAAAGPDARQEGKSDARHEGKTDGKAGAPQTVAGPVTLPPIVGPLRAPGQVWVRFEGVVVVDEMDAARAKTMAAEIADDSLVYFNTISLLEIEGAAGLKAVREDLLERARIRGAGKVRDLLIQTLVTQ